MPRGNVSRLGIAPLLPVLQPPASGLSSGVGHHGNCQVKVRRERSRHRQVEDILTLREFDQPVTEYLRALIGTNSILVVAPPSLIEEVRKFAEELDRAAAEHPRRAVRIVPLKKTNAAEVDRALQRVLSPRRRRR